ncbi:KRI1-like family C-terminal-domain-containing protein [Zychaea mexicana]|uniref:KRI1-like family C-terminal-domain-containing protein n=1 Tax=Zychaea mexicana TaxID=64656 RepID=UPI0022FF2FFB|nr:KRI1-like family C-terminal-domain-containing protein [Zychaea mexicana]KAI9496483.1 KRI1-like family C-terminal-domain-containing protein [Zychaea mexicana]
MSNTEEIQVQIRERTDEDADYERPAILQESEHEGSDQGSGDESESEEEEEESEDEEEDENAAMLTPAVDSQILRTIAAIQTKDPRVYDANNKFFNEQDLATAKQNFLKKKKLMEAGDNKKSYTLKDYEREVLLEHGGYVNEEEEQVDNGPRSHYQEQRDIKNEFLNAVKAVDSEESDDDDEGLGGGLLEKRIKTKEEEEEEDAKYRNFMLQNIASDEATAKAFKDWNDNYKENPNVSKDDAFLIDYVLNRGWVEKPSDKKQGTQGGLDKDVDEEHLDEVDRFESKYNFRFEEEGGASLVSHSRNVEESVRRKLNKRQKERERKKLKRETMIREKNEELGRARNQKMKEIHDRLKEIRDITGNDAMGLDNLDLEGDFDPTKYDEQMEKMFGEDYYENGLADDAKPTWNDDIDTTMYEDEEGDQFYEAQDHQSDEDVMMDADYLPGGDEYEATRSKRKRGVDVQVEQAQKKQKTKELLDEYYSLNFEDVIGGDLPTRYKYRKAEPENFGLSAEEILLADDVELNKYVGMKMLAPYRNERKLQHERWIFNKNRNMKYKDFSKHIQAKLQEVDPEASSSSKKYHKNSNDGEVKKLRKRRGKKKKQTADEA